MASSKRGQRALRDSDALWRRPVTSRRRSPMRPTSVRWQDRVTRWSGWLALWVAFLAAAPTFAQAPEQADPPGRVARIAETFGQVWLFSPDAGEWISAVRNRPVTTGDRIATDHDAKVEL